MKKKWVLSLVAGYFLLFTLSAVAYGLFWYGMDRAPEQPIAFSHKVHIEKAGLDCTSCHEYIDEGLLPSIPSVQTCIACHQESQVKLNSPEVQKLIAYWEQGETIPWVKVHKFAERKNVLFTHKRHLRSDVFTEHEAVADRCAVCHGDVSSMDVVKKVRPHKMGWCVSCHQQTEASIDCWTCHK